MSYPLFCRLDDKVRDKIAAYAQTLSSHDKIGNRSRQSLCRFCQSTLSAGKNTTKWMFVLGVILYFCRVCENDPHFVARPTKWKPDFVVGRQSCEKPLLMQGPVVSKEKKKASCFDHTQKKKDGPNPAHGAPLT